MLTFTKNIMLLKIAGKHYGIHKNCFEEKKDKFLTIGYKILLISIIYLLIMIFK